MAGKSRGLWVWLAAALVVGSLLAGWYWWKARAEQELASGLASAREAIASGRVATARTKLVDLVRSFPGRAEAALLLGDSELALGRPEQAVLHWEAAGRAGSIGSAWSREARLRLAEGRLAELDPDLMPESGYLDDEDRADALRIVGTALKIQGRLAEAGDFYRSGFDHLGPPADQLVELWNIEYGEYPVERIRELLASAHRDHSEDDRVWLGLANLAAREGKYNEAASWLDRCAERRPYDTAVWRSRLELARLSDDPSAAAEAVRRLPAGVMRPAETLELAAWFAGHRRDTTRRAEALAAAIELEPRARWVEELAALEMASGRRGEVAKLRDRKATIDRALDRYKALVLEPEPASKAGELAALAGDLGWKFEAARWRILAGGPVPSEVAAARKPDLDDLCRELDGVSGLPRAARGGGLPPPPYEDAANRTGLHFAYEPGSTLPGRTPPEMMGGGVAFFDYDGDGYLDIFLPQGGTFPPPPDAPNADRLYRNQGDGTFEERSIGVGLASMPGGYGFGVIAGDFDGDGRTDILVTRWRSLLLLRNTEGGFVDATESAGLGDTAGWPTSAAFADLDADGDLDLYVCQYLDYEPEKPPLLAASERQGGNPYNPLGYKSLPDRLYRNDGGRFVDVSDSSGVAAADVHGRGLGVVVVDADADGRLDIFVSNDMTANFLFINKGGWIFEESAQSSGVAAAADGGYRAGMGVAAGDLDGDGRIDLAVTNFYNEGTTYYQNLGDGVFAERSAEVGLRACSRLQLGFGLEFLDANLDGRLDVATANGHVNDFRPEVPFVMPMTLFLSTASGRFTDVTSKMPESWRRPRLGRGLASGDLDRDGRPDLIAVFQDAPVAWFRHDGLGAEHWLVLALEATGSARSSEGTRVEVTAGGRSITRWRTGGGSYVSSSAPELIFGLGDAVEAEKIEVFWPSGRIDTFSGLGAGTGWKLREGERAPLPLFPYPTTAAP